MSVPISRRLRKTPGDYLAIAIAPVLIMVLVGSLIFFLSEAMYRGSHAGRLRWTLAWFTLASVLITRIAVELGSARGFVYGFALAGVTTLSLIRFVDPPFAGIILLAVAWASVDRLVRDCTLIDDDEDATGEGLLDLAGLSGPPSATGEKRAPGRLLFVQHATEEARRLVADNPEPTAEEGGGITRKAARPPGLWLVSFSLAALPLFGLGQAFLPAADAARREIAFTCLWFYLLSAFGLLLTTHFLGLRRYLRQRRIQMPATIAFPWMIRGAVMALAVLLLALLVPRPEATYSLSAIAERLGSRPATASRVAAGGGSGGTGSSTATTATGTTEPNSPPRGSPPGTDGSREPSPSESRSGRTAGKPPLGDRTTTPAQTIDDTSRTSPASRSLPELGRVLKWGIYCAFALAILAILVRHGAGLWAGLCDLWRDLWSWRRPKTATKAGGEIADTGRSSTPFSTFRNPFLDSRLKNRSPGELVIYSFDALQAWAAHFGLPRQSEETPFEFGQRLGQSIPEIDAPVRDLVDCYSRLAYAEQLPGGENLSAARQIWAYMTRRN